MQTVAKIETARVPANQAITRPAVSGEVTKVTQASQGNVVELNTDDRIYQRMGVLVLLLVFGGFGLWAGFAPIGSHAVAPGRVLVKTEKQVIQHREGGVIDEILVKDGDIVEKGQKLLVISPTDAKASLGSLEEHFLSNLALEARLNAELEGDRSVVFPKELSDSRNPRVKEIMADELQQFKVRRAAADADTAALRQRMLQTQDAIKGVEGQIVAQDELKASFATEVSTLQGLNQRQLISKMQVDEAQRKYLSTKTNIAELASNKAGLHGKVGELEEELILQTNSRKKEIAAKLGETRTQIADLRNRLNAAQDVLNRSVIVAPMAGKVIGMGYNTVGGVVQAGSPIMDIVPKSTEFEIESKVEVSDIDRVFVGQKAEIMFSAFPAKSKPNPIFGEVVLLSADTVSDESTGTAYYNARLKVSEEGLQELARNKLELVQGMPAEAIIITGDRTLLEYLVEPITTIATHALNED